MSSFNRESVGRLVLQALHEYPDGCDFLITCFATAVTHIRRASVCAPYPPEICVNSRGEKDFEACKTCIRSFPTISKLQSPREISRLSEASLRMLGWLLGNARQRHKLTLITPPEFELCTMTRFPHMSKFQWPETCLPKYILRVDGGGSSKGSESVFGSKETCMCFHGTSMENVHSILQNGLLNMSGTKLMRHGAVFGNGIYLTTELSVANHFSKSAKGWRKSKFGTKLRCIFVCEAAEEDEDEIDDGGGDKSRLPQAYVCVTRPDHVRITHVLVFDESPLDTSKIDWCTVIIFVYILFMVWIGQGMNTY